MPPSVRTSRGLANDDGDREIVTPCMQDVDDAIYRVAHEHPGGVPALAQRMGIPASTLNLKVSLTVDTHHLRVRESIHMQAVAQRYDVLQAEAWALDHVCFHVPTQAPAQIGMRLATVGAEVGDIFRRAEKYLADGKITPNERRQLSKEIHEAAAALGALLKVL